MSEKISEATSKKCCWHLWYLTEEAMGLAFFDELVSVEQEVKMTKAFKERESSNFNSKRLNVLFEEIAEFIHKEVHHFGSKHTFNFFKRFKMPSDFITTDAAI